MKERRDAGIDRLRKSQTANEFVIWEVLPWRPKSVRPVQESPRINVGEYDARGEFFVAACHSRHLQGLAFYSWNTCRAFEASHPTLAYGSGKVASRPGPPNTEEADT